MKDKSFAKKSTQNKSNETAIDQSIVVGLDIGTTKIACFVGVKNDHGKIEIISFCFKNRGTIIKYFARSQAYTNILFLHKTLFFFCENN